MSASPESSPSASPQPTAAISSESPPPATGGEDQPSSAPEMEATPVVSEDGLSPEQRAFLAECEKEFANRYTEADKEFMQFKNAPKLPPPCVCPWKVRPRRDFHQVGTLVNICRMFLHNQSD